MKAALYKEFRLTSPALYLWMLLGAMVMIPNYPKIVSMVYVLWEIGVYLQMKKDNRDFEFSSILPISEKTGIAGTAQFIGFLEFGQIAVAAICAPISNLLINVGVNVGLPLNFTFFGVALLTFAAFNIVLIPLFYKRGRKIALPVLLAGLLYAAVYIIIELLINFVPPLNVLASLDPSAFGWQSIVFIAGALAFCASLVGSYEFAAKVGKNE